MKLNPIRLMLILFFIQVHDASAVPDDGNRSLQIDDASLEAIILNINEKNRLKREAHRREVASENSTDDSSAPAYSVVPRPRPEEFAYFPGHQFLNILTDRSVEESKTHTCLRQFVSENPDVELTGTDAFKFFSLCPLSDAYSRPVAPNPDDPASRRLKYEPTSFCECVNQKQAQAPNSNLSPYRPLSRTQLGDRAEEIQSLIISLNIGKLTSDYHEFSQKYDYIKNSPDFHSLYYRTKGESIEANSLVRCDPIELASLPSHLAAEGVCGVDTANSILKNIVSSSAVVAEVGGEGGAAHPPVSDRESFRRTADNVRSSTRNRTAGNRGSARETVEIANSLASTTACVDYEAATSGEACRVAGPVAEGSLGNLNLLNQANQDELFKARIRMTEGLTGVLNLMHKNNGNLDNLKKPNDATLKTVKNLVMTNPFLRRELFPGNTSNELSSDEVFAKMTEYLSDTVYPALQEVIKLDPQKRNINEIDLNLTLQALTFVSYPHYKESLRGCEKIIRRISNLCEAIDKGNPVGDKPQISPFLQNVQLMRPLFEASSGDDPNGLIQSIITDSSQIACNEYGRAKMQNRGLSPVFASVADTMVDSLTADLRVEVSRLTERSAGDYATANTTKNMFDVVANGERPPAVSRTDSLVTADTRREADLYGSEQLASTQKANAAERARQTAELSDQNSKSSALESSGSGVVSTDEVIYNSTDASIARPTEEALFSAAQVKTSQPVTNRLREEMTEEEIANLSPHEQRLLDELDRLSAREAKLEEDLRRSEKERDDIRNKSRQEEQDRLIASLKNELKTLKTEMADLSKNLSQPARVAVDKITAPASSAAKISSEPIRSNSKVVASDSNGGNTGGQVGPSSGQALAASGGGVRNTTATPLIPTRSAAGVGVISGGASPLLLTNRLNSSDASISQLAESQNAVVYRQTNMAGFVEKIVFKTVDGRVLFENGEPVIEETQLIAMEETEIQAWLAQMSQSTDGRYPASVSETPELIELERRSTPSARHNNLIEEIQKQRELIGTEN